MLLIVNLLVMNLKIVKKKESYERLSPFIWEIKDIKKAVMTIPYNV